MPLRSINDHSTYFRNPTGADAEEEAVVRRGVQLAAPQGGQGDAPACSAAPCGPPEPGRLPEGADLPQQVPLPAHLWPEHPHPGEETR